MWLRVLSCRTIKGYELKMCKYYFSESMANVQYIFVLHIIIVQDVC